MWFRFPEDFFWNLNAEQGYGTLFSTLQLFVLRIVVLMAARPDFGLEASLVERLSWFLVAFVYSWIGCVSLCSRMVMVLWPHGRCCGDVLCEIFFATLFLFSKNYRHDVFHSGIMDSSSGARGSLKKYGRSFGFELRSYIDEGFEMRGATLFMMGFSWHLKNLQEKARAKYWFLILAQTVQSYTTISIVSKGWTGDSNSCPYISLSQ